jgi:predicted RNA-binding Zn ribbon-like protein
MKNVKGVTSMMGSAVHAATRAAEVISVLISDDALDESGKAKVETILSRYGERQPRIAPEEYIHLRSAAKELHAIFAAATEAEAASRINLLLRTYGGQPRLTSHDSSPWHLHLDQHDDAPWTEWFVTSSAFALAVLLAEKQRKPGGICSAKACNNPFIDRGKGGGRSYCSPRCATRERVAHYRTK